MLLLLCSDSGPLNFPRAREHFSGDIDTLDFREELPLIDVLRAVVEDGAG